MITIIQSGRKGLIKHCENYCSFLGVKHNTIDIKRQQLEKFIQQIKKTNIFIISNGNDQQDKNLTLQLKQINPNAIILFGEFAWFNWKYNIYLDETGIGNKSFLFDKPLTYFKNFNQYVYDYYYQQTLLELKIGEKLTKNNYILIPLQVDKDSKLEIGSPHFKTVDDFLLYITSKYLIGFDGEILVKKHPNDKRNLSDIIPLVIQKHKHQIVDITNKNYNKYDLIMRSQQVIGINSTFLMETILLGKKPIIFGLDIFSNKNITIDGNIIPFNDIIANNNTITDKNVSNFIYALMSRQINKWDKFNAKIMSFCYWNDYIKNKII